MTDEELMRLLRAHAALPEEDERARQQTREEADAGRAEAHREPASLRSLFELLAEPLLAQLGIGAEYAAALRVVLYRHAAELPRGTAIAEHLGEWCVAFARVLGRTDSGKLTPDAVLRLTRAAVVRAEASRATAAAAPWSTWAAEALGGGELASWADVLSLRLPAEYREDAAPFSRWQEETAARLRRVTREHEATLLGT
jgi:hypothetical protein